MGHYKLELLAVGGHGCQRDRGDGVAVLGCNISHCPDCIIRECLRRLQRSGSNVERALLTHWPASEPGLGYIKENEVQDDLRSGMRTGSFSLTALKGHPFEIKLSVNDGDPVVHRTNRRTVRGLLEEVFGEAALPTPGEYENDYQTKSGVYRFTNPGGSAYSMCGELKSLVAGWSQSDPRPWRIVKQAPQPTV